MSVKVPLRNTPREFSNQKNPDYLFNGSERSKLLPPKMAKKGYSGSPKQPRGAKEVYGSFAERRGINCFVVELYTSAK